MLKRGKLYKFAGYEWMIADTYHDYAILQSTGVTHGKWPGYVLSKFGNGNCFNKDIDGLDISEYDDKTKSLYEQIKAVECRNAMYGNGLYLINDIMAEHRASKHALVKAANNSISFGAISSAAWLGIVDGGYYAWFVDSGGIASYGNYQGVDFVVAPAFNLDMSKIEVVGDEIVIRDDYLETEKEYTQEEIEIMTEYEDTISRRAAQAKIKNICDEYRLSYEDGERKAATGGSAYALGHAFDDLPPVMPQPKMGRWIVNHDESDDSHTIDCSCCNYTLVRVVNRGYTAEMPLDSTKGIMKNYCPSCGAKMQHTKSRN